MCDMHPAAVQVTSLQQYSVIIEDFVYYTSSCMIWQWSWSLVQFCQYYFRFYILCKTYEKQSHRQCSLLRILWIRYLITFDIDRPEAYVSWHNILLYRWMISFLSVLLFNDIVEQYSKINFVPYVFECRENAYYFSLFLIYQISLFLVSQGWQIWYSQWTGH